MMWVVAAALIDPAGRILIQQRPAGKSLAGQWEFPGGKVEASETPKAALIRELHEELNIEVVTGDLSPIAFASDEEGEIAILLYLCRQYTGEMIVIDAQQVEWLPIETILTRPMPLIDIDLAEQLAARLPGLS